MKYFSALADAEFARAAFAAAGIDFESAKSAKNTDCLKAALAAAKANSEAETILAQAKQENDELAGRVGELEAAQTIATATVTNLTAAITANTGVTVTIAADGTINAEAIKTAHDAKVTKAARDMVARAGHPGLLDDPAIDPTKQQRVDSKTKDENAPQLTGRDRMAAAFSKEIAILNRSERRRRTSENN